MVDKSQRRKITATPEMIARRMTALEKIRKLNPYRDITDPVVWLIKSQLITTHLARYAVSKMNRATIEVRGHSIAVLNRDRQDYLSLTDIARYRNSQEPFAVINHWMRSRSTIEFRGLWEKLCNPDFEPGGFKMLKNKS